MGVVEVVGASWGSFVGLLGRFETCPWMLGRLRPCDGRLPIRLPEEGPSPGRSMFKVPIMRQLFALTLIIHGPNLPDILRSLYYFSKDFQRARSIGYVEIRVPSDI